MKVIFAGGGTGGHLFPAIAIAEEFMKRDKLSKILFIGTNKGIEKNIVPKAGYKLEKIIADGIKGKGFKKKIIALLKIPLSIFQSFNILIMKKPDIVIGMGGYASVPTLFTTYFLGIPSIIHEQNRVPGLANKFLIKLVDKIAVTFNESLDYFPEHKTLVTGNPVREDLKVGIKNKQQPNKKFTIFIFGGSQGASSINLSMLDGLEFLSDLKDKITFIHQTGNKDFTVIKQAYKNKNFIAEVCSFINNMAECYSKANLVICRAGATTIAELSICGKPSILIPYPFAANNHQEKNAMLLKEHNAAKVILDRNLTGKILAEKIRFFINNKIEAEKMVTNSKKFARPDAAKKIVDMAYELIH